MQFSEFHNSRRGEGEKRPNTVGKHSLARQFARVPLPVKIGVLWGEMRSAGSRTEGTFGYSERTSDASF